MLPPIVATPPSWFNLHAKVIRAVVPRRHVLCGVCMRRCVARSNETGMPHYSYAAWDSRRAAINRVAIRFNLISARDNIKRTA